MIAFHRLHHSPNEQAYITQVLQAEQWAGNGGPFSNKCKDFFKQKYGFSNTWLTHSCTSALETAAMLLDIQPGDEIILPSYTYVGTATAFAREKATLVFADSRADHPNMSLEDCAKKITPRTRAIVLVHYGGVAHDMEKWVALARAHNIVLIEDAAHSIHSFYNGKPLGSFGDISTFSFHLTKNISCGEGGLLVINNAEFVERAQIIMDKGTNRAAFNKKEIPSYGWVGKGSSFVISEILCALLWSQLEILEEVTAQRKNVWNSLYEGFKQRGFSLSSLPVVPEASAHNAHIFYLVFSSPQLMQQTQQKLGTQGIITHTHYQSLHNSVYIKRYGDGVSQVLINSDIYTNRLLRVPCHGLIDTQSVNSLINNNLISI